MTDAKSPTPDDFKEAAEALDLATATYEEMRRRAAQANSEECTALNRLNDAQKRMRTIVEARMAAAPRGTDWFNKRNAKEWLTASAT